MELVAVRRLDAWLRRQRKATIIAIGVVLVAGLGYLDYLTVFDLAPLVYLGPVSLVAWYAGWWSAAVMAVATAPAWLLSEMWTTAPGTHPAVPYWNVAIRFAGFLVVSYTVSALRASLDRESELERTDPLTGVANLRSFYELAEAEIARARRYTHPFTVAYIDLDGFKAINDHLGHTAGDDVLRTVARGIKDSVRRTDLVARVGGDEFVVLLPETSAAPARLVIRKVQEVVARVTVPDGSTLGSSMGVATYFSPPATVDALMQTADSLMYDAKGAGKNAVEHRTFN
jgi:diguanylate cyclase (GGDEF)-like protein